MSQLVAFEIDILRVVKSQGISGGFLIICIGIHPILFRADARELCQHLGSFILQTAIRRKVTLYTEVVVARLAMECVDGGDLSTTHVATTLARLNARKVQSVALRTCPGHSS